MDSPASSMPPLGGSRAPTPMHASGELPPLNPDQDPERALKVDQALAEPSPAPEEGPKTKGPQLNIKLRTTEPPREMHFKVKPNTPWTRILEEWSKRMGKEDDLRWMDQNGARLRVPQADEEPLTVESAGLEDGDTIEGIREMVGGETQTLMQSISGC